MSLTPQLFESLVAEANLAPSVHNTQPTRWRIEPDGTVQVFEDPAHRLPVGDPRGHDAEVSHGAAVEGFAIACAANDLAVSVGPARDGAGSALRGVACLHLERGAAPDPLRPLTGRRRTFRGAFRNPGAPAELATLEAAPDVRLIADPAAVAWMAELNDAASLRSFRDGAYRRELLSWMRLSRRDPRWALDGLNAEVMEMSGLEAFGAGLVLRPRVFEALDGLGLARLLTGEAAVVRSAQALLLFHRPADEAPFLTGRRFYRLWLEIAALGRSAAPMTVLADDAAARAAIAQAFDLPEHRRLVTVFRIGVAPPANGPKARLPVSALIV